MTNLKYPHLFFDLDNTLWSSERNSRSALKEMFLEKKVSHRFALDFDDFIRHYEQVNENLWSELRDNKINKKTLRHLRFKNSFEHFNLYNKELTFWFENTFPTRAIKFSHLVAGAIEMLDNLKAKGYQMHIVTNGFKEVSRKKISSTALKGRFNKIICADEINIRKPDPRIFNFSLRQANAKLEESIFIGDDWLADAIGAADFGMKSLFFNRKNENLSDPRVVNFDTLNNLVPLINKI